MPIQMSDKKTKSPKAYYIRKGSNTIKANVNEEQQLLSISEAYHSMTDQILRQVSMISLHISYPIS